MGRMAPQSPPAASPSEFPLVEVRPHNGTPTLFVAGAPASAFAYVGDVPAHCRQMAEAGLRLSSFVSRCQYAFYPDPPDLAEAAARIAEHDEKVRAILAAWPGVLFFPRLQLETPVWWAERYPEEVACYDAGGGEIKPIISPKHGIPSWASTVWLDQTKVALAGYIRHLRASGLAWHFAGFHLAAGTSAEWMAHGANSGLFIDYSRPGLRHFRAWLRGKYGDASRLREAWNDAAATFETVTIPSRDLRAAFDGQYLLDPRVSRAIIDYAQSFSDQAAEAIAAFAREVKDRTARRSCVGVFYGYVLQLCNEQRQQNAGHNSIRRVLDCPDIDFIASPGHYGNRRIGEGYGSFMTPTESVRVHGKLWYNENDYLSPLCRMGAQDSGAKTVDEYAEVLKFAHAGAVTGGVAQWLLSFNDGWYDDPKLRALLARQQEIEREALSWDRGSVADVAVVVDDESQLYQPVANVLPEFKRESASEMLIYDLPPRIGRCGTAVDWVLLDDLDRLRPYKLYIVLNALALDERKRSLLEWRRRGGATILWMWAPGAIDPPKGLDAAWVSDLVGMRVSMSGEEVPVRVRFDHTQAGHPLLGRSMETVAEMGNDHKIAPHFWIDDPEATVLARFTEDDRPAIGFCKLADWTSIYVAAPLTLNESFVREVARYAGAHIYHEGPDATYIGNGLIGLHAATAGVKRLRLPRGAAEVRELYGGKTVARDTDTVELHVGRFETVLLRWSAGA